MKLGPTSDLWWKNAIVYCLDVETFLDSDGDGVGDFEGLVRQIDYLAGLGVTCLWLMPFYPSPNRTTGTTSAITARWTRGWEASAISWSWSALPMTAGSR